MKQKLSKPVQDDDLKKRSKEAEEMAKIWEQSDPDTQMYLKGCIATVSALAGNKKAG